MARLPKPGFDDGAWGDILNDFLEQEHSTDGMLKIRSDGTLASKESIENKAQPNGYASLNNSKLVPTDQLGLGSASSSTFLRGDGTWSVINTGSSSLAADTDVAIVSPSDQQILTYDSGSHKWINQAPPISSVAGKTGTVVLSKSDVGLANVDNTADSNKPVSTAQQAALNTKADKVVITGSTKTKITYNAQGIVTGGTDASTADIADSPNRRYITDAQQTLINNTSGTNTGDQTLTISGHNLTISGSNGNQITLPSGGITRSVNTVSTATAAGAAANTDYVYFASGTTTITLPSAIGNSNRYTIKNTGSNTITIATSSGQTIDGSSSINLAVANISVDLISDGVNWQVV